ncbi:hypothetical protein F6R98_14740 [Candidatus Methylospira mobilis]|uniref:PepSY domain-containing protein n=1 Tax=Candidatus Methylospira mobilis TaxID=1808979 RepID=A0A5Q0BNQ7_9GAMM|nr:PepSY-like domain-containing protein [Candidatus Methylospira mobilis]QFY43727.1 hypothetical protein F6R98_14740 [Candidatus Methylospira mobilis]WNV04714.1 PepSY-like domain-containing protein [Candidatus Methylospira mobilis]
MKRILIIGISFLGALIVSGSVMADKDITEQQVPPAVLRTFKSVYPNVSGVEYEEKVKNGQTVYKFEFKDNGLEHEVVYSADGKVVKAKLEH